MDQNRGMHSMEAMPMCPMASICKSMARNGRFGVMLMIPGVLLLGAGILIFVEPNVLAWLVASVSILFGVVMLLFALFIRRMMARPTSADR